MIKKALVWIEENKFEMDFEEPLQIVTVVL